MMTEISLREQIERSAHYILERTEYRPRVGLVLGSGLGLLAERVIEPDTIAYAAIPHFPQSTVAGHSGRLLIGCLGGVQVAVLQGRAHYYEGHSAAEVSLPVRVLRALGVDTLLITNAAGGIRQGFEAGDLMAIVDHINLVGLGGHHPLRGPNDETIGPRFPDMSRAYAPELLELLRKEARAHSIQLHEGVYAMVAGPSFETPAEIRFLRLIGADAVGMSTVPEVIVARHGGMRVLAVSLISNVAIDSHDRPEDEASHAEVLAAGQTAAPMLALLLEGVLQRLGRS